MFTYFVVYMFIYSVALIAFCGAGAFASLLAWQVNARTMKNGPNDGNSYQYDYEEFFGGKDERIENLLGRLNLLGRVGFYASVYPLYFAGRLGACFPFSIYYTKVGIRWVLKFIFYKRAS